MRTAEEIYSECLEKYIKGDSELSKICNTQRQLYVYAMKLYANQKLDEAAEKASVDLHYRNGGNTVWSASVNKQSILKFKDKL